MGPGLFIARRYLFAKKSHNVINIISLISVVGVMVGTTGLIIVLSVFNGFSGLVISLYNSFDPDIKISAVAGKTFDPSALDTNAIKSLEGISFMSLSLEENALVKYRDRQMIATIKGVDDNFFRIATMDDKIIEGSSELVRDGKPFALTGASIAYSLSLSLTDPFNLLSIYIPKKGRPASVLNPEDAFNIELIRPGGVFAIQQDFDAKYVLVPLDFAREIIGQDKKISAMELGIAPGADEDELAALVQQVAGPAFKVETRLQQHEFLYRILKSEKWAVYFILSFILVIAIFNIIGSLTMLIIDKKKDIAILSALGAERKLIRNIFLAEGLMITLSGALAGMLIGGIVCYLQQQFGFIRLDDGESFIINAYPVEMQVTDFINVFLIVFLIGFAAAMYTASRVAGRQVADLKAG